MTTPQTVYLADENRTYQYYAFISYKHLDKRWAKWVQRQLEYYRLPNRLCREKNTPKHVTPIFRDETDLTGGKNVKTHLIDNVNRSKFLIVICTKHMQVNPQYIDYEIESFLAAGNPPSRILPLIIDGEANSTDPEKECLPPALKALGDDMPLGITMNHKKRKDTVLKLIASILELDLSSLRSHDRERKNRTVVASLCGGLAASLALGAFIAWEALKVKEAGLKEQLAYAESTFRQGDRLTAAKDTEKIKDDHLFLMDPGIRASADDLAFLSAIHPKYQPLVQIAPRTSDSRLCFTADGKHLLVITDNSVNKYTMQGENIMSFDVSQSAHQIVDVSADGVHAAVVSFYLPGAEGSHLWLWNMETNTAVTSLVSSAAYDQTDQKTGYLSSVVNAAFSPDGRIICAYRDSAGYYNENEELAAWDATTGEKLFSLPGSLLGKMNQPYEVEAFAFIGNDTFHWTGSSNHVFYTLGEAEPVVIGKNKLPRSIRGGGSNLVSLENCRYTACFDAASGSFTLQDLATGTQLQIGEIPDCRYADCGDRLVLFIENEEGLCGLKLCDLKTMQCTTLDDQLVAMLKGARLSYTEQLQGSPYLYVTADDNSIYRLTIETGECLSVVQSSSCKLLASTGEMDILISGTGDEATLLEVSGQQVRRHLLDQSADKLAETAVFSPSTPYMAMERNGDYYLYSLVNPGQKLEASQGAFSGVQAAGPDGKLVVQGSDASLLAWYEGRLILETTPDSSVCSVWAGNDRFFALTGQSLTVYDQSGAVLQTMQAGPDIRYLSAKADAAGNHILLLSQERIAFENLPCILTLLNGTTLETVSQLSGSVHVAPSSAYTVAYDISRDGSMAAAVERVTQTDSTQYMLSLSVYSCADGRMLAQSQNINNEDVPVFDLISHSGGISSAYRQQYVTFGAGKTLLSGLQYGTWIFDLEKLETRSFLSEGSNSDALPLLLSDGRLLYPASGLHVWNTKTGKMEAALAHSAPETDINAMLKPENQNRLLLSDDEAWTAFTGRDQTWLYRTGEWATSAMLSPQRCQVLHLSRNLIVYATPEGIWHLSVP